MVAAMAVAAGMLVFPTAAGAASAPRLYLVIDGNVQAYNATTFQPITGATDSGEGGTAYDVSTAKNGLIVISDSVDNTICPDYRIEKTIGHDRGNQLDPPLKPGGSDPGDYAGGAVALSGQGNTLAYLGGTDRAIMLTDGDSCSDPDYLQIESSSGKTPFTVQPAPGLTYAGGLALNSAGTTAAVDVSRGHQPDVIAVIKVGSTHDLASAQLISAGHCALDDPAYLPDGTIAAAERCGTTASLVLINSHGSISQAGKIPGGSRALRAVTASSDGRVLVATAHNLYLLYAGHKGGLHQVRISLTIGSKPDPTGSIYAAAWA